MCKQGVPRRWVPKIDLQTFLILKRINSLAKCFNSLEILCVQSDCFQIKLDAYLVEPGQGRD